MAPIVWPVDVLKPRHMSPSKSPATTKGSPSLSGITQRAASDAGRWRLRISEFPVVTADAVRTWRAIEGLAGGQLGQIVIEIEDLDRAPEPNGDAGPVYFSDDASFDDGSGLSQPWHVAEIAEAAALGSTTVSILTTSGDNPEAGQIFSVNYRLYSINKITATDGATVTATVWPPLREGMAPGDEARFYRPQLLCRLADDDAMTLEPLDHGRWVFPDCEFIEDTGAVEE